MKNILVVLVLSIGFSQFTYANELPRVGNISIVVKMGHELAAVQPTATIKFTIASCGPRLLELNTRKKNDTVFITIYDKDDSDCRAMEVEREYSFQVSSDASRENYVLLNPISPLILVD